MPRSVSSVIRLATRGSALALAQANLVLAQCRQAFPELNFQLKIIKTTGDKLQTAALANPAASTKGLFTKELELALLDHEADLAVHSLKDLPTDLPHGLQLAAVCPRADVRDVLIYRDAAQFEGANTTPPPAPGERAKRGFKAGLTLQHLPPAATVATSSTRRQAQLLGLRPDLKTVPVRGNVGTRLQKLADQAGLDALILAAAGLARLGFTITPAGQLVSPPMAQTPGPDGLLAAFLDLDVMLPCVGQAAIGLETRPHDKRIRTICAALNHLPTFHCVTAERAFLRTMGGGCQSPVGALAEICDGQVHLRAISFRNPPPRRAEGRRPIDEAAALGADVAAQLLG